MPRIRDQGPCDWGRESISALIHGVIFAEQAHYQKVNILPVCTGADPGPPGHVGCVVRQHGTGSSAQRQGLLGLGGFTPGTISSLPLTHHLLLSTILSSHVSKKHLGLCPRGLDILTEEAHHRSL